MDADVQTSIVVGFAPNHCISASQFDLGCGMISGEVDKERTTTMIGSQTTVQSTGQCKVQTSTTQMNNIDKEKTILRKIKFLFRYTNRNRDSYGQSAYEYGITCRNILTDPEIHSQLKQNHADNPYYRHQYIFSYDNDLADVGNIRFFAYRNNMILELCMAG